MLSKRDLFILFLVLISAAVIFFANNGKTANKENQEREISEKQNQSYQSIIFFQESNKEKNEENTENLISEEELKINTDNKLSVLQTVSKEKIVSKKIEEIPSLNDVLAEVNNLASDLKLEFEKYQQEKDSCPDCSKSGSTCATILSAVGACNCASLGCTPPHGPWCVNPCCCVCCPACCR